MTLLFMLFWLILNGRADSDVLITGAAATAVMMLAVCLWGGWSFRKELSCYLIIPRGIVYFALLMVEILKANLTVIRIIFKKEKLEPCVRTFKTSLKTAAARTVFANSITLTPGTVTVQLIDDVLTVNCLNSELAEGLNGWILEKKLLEIEKSFAKEAGEHK